MKGTISTVTSAHIELQKQLAQLREICTSISTYQPIVLKPPIIDSTRDALDQGRRHEDLPGLRAFAESVKRDMDVIQKYLVDPQSFEHSPPSTNSPYLVAVWKEVLTAPPPVIGIGLTYNVDKKDNESVKVTRSTKRMPTELYTKVKVDVVADNGRSLIRINTIKNSRLLAEFREIDSYDTESDSDSDTGNLDASLHTTNWLTLAQTELDNSILRMARVLLAAASNNSIGHSFSNSSPGTTDPDDIPNLPKIILCLPRLDPSPKDSTLYDPRIGQTIRRLQDLGIEVRLGDDASSHNLSPHVWPVSPYPLHLCPTAKVNLDLSVLIALVSDLTHAQLPASSEEARDRFILPTSVYPRKRERKSTNISSRRTVEGSVQVERHGDPDSVAVDADADGANQHWRQLVDQQRLEMAHELLDEMRTRLIAFRAPSESNGNGNDAEGTLSGVEFWTTAEARDRFLDIVTKIGGPNERRRGRALFTESDSSPTPTELSDMRGAFWRGSRYALDFLPLHPIHIFPTNSSSLIKERSSKAEAHPFFSALQRTCRHLLANSGSNSGSSPDSGIQCPLNKSNAGTVIGHEIDKTEIPPPRALRGNGRLTAHTTYSLLLGAVHGYTTLTANRASARSIVKVIEELEVKDRSWYWNMCGTGNTRVTREGLEGVPECTGEAKAAMWVVEPRSLAEAMRADFNGRTLDS
ncbi:hypothetical protein HETIRDRAFT_65560 [Heterobasidion irregulare TC 32-1]|uniref:DUF1308 domain-containing protein n=1 Tax=Heterobasidion irregulare (strain TC 32-1) TaxID=747525 RepID=W4JV07_HETIT|nr:uncharacterized protein HETIRDRAFT_65560 [Heterobasidion irregulare TC 32-1]ETW77294.1 hypothetical protein HETIRDRAFT_65560 [Heterobasidion irregulare TC 32-1]